MEIVDRYVHAVLARLPKEQRMNIERELRALIDDMIKKHSQDESELSKAEKVLLELGNPEVLAEKYMNKGRFLIGPRYYNLYILLLKIVLGAVFLGISISAGFGSTFSPERGFHSVVFGYLSTLTSGLAQGFVWVTLIFALIEYRGIDLSADSDFKKQWSLKDLPKAKGDKADIPVINPILGIVFSSIFIMILYFAPQFFAAYIPLQNGRLVRIPFFISTALSQYKALIMVLFLATIAKETVKLIYRRWTIRSSIMYSLLNIVALILTIVVFSNPNVWNSDFFSQLAIHLNIGVNSNINTSLLWRQILNGGIVVLLAGNVIDIATSIYKGVKYNPI
jgi:hypothetical protein